MTTAIYVHEKAGGKSGGQNERGRNRYHNEWIVKMSDATATRANVLGCGGLPVYGSPNAEDTKAICIRVDAKRHQDAPNFWDAEADWEESPVSGRDPTDDQKQPDLRRPKWSSRFTPFPVSRFLDYAGNLLCDRAGTPFDPIPDMPIYCEEVTVSQYEATAGRAASTIGSTARAVKPSFFRASGRSPKAWASSRCRGPCPAASRSRRPSGFRHSSRPPA